MKNHVNQHHTLFYKFLFIVGLTTLLTSHRVVAQIQPSLKAADDAKPAKATAVKLIKNKANKLYSSKQLKEDLEILHQAFQEAHPGFYWYTNKQDFDRKFDSVRNLLNHPMRELEFYRLVRPLVVMVNCGHTQLYTSLKYRSFFRKKSRYFPLNLKFIEGKAYIYQNHSTDTTIQLGAQVLTINNEPIEKLVEKMFRYTPSDGFNLTYKYRILDQDFPSLYPYYVNARVDSFKVACVDIKSKHPIEYKIASISRRKYRKSRRALKQEEEPALDFKILGGYDEEVASNSRSANDNLLRKAKVAVLTIKSFQNNTLRKQGFSFSQYMRTIFRTIRKKRIKNLIIDLRENSGGTVRNGILLYSYLTRRKFKYFNYEQVTTSRPFTFMRHVNSYKSRMVNTKLLVKTDSGYFISQRLHYNLKTHRPSKYHYKRNLYILINGRSFSATTQFASLVHANHRAVFVGEETGGGYKGCTAGRTCYINLPNTKMRLKIPLIKYSNAVAQDYQVKGHGIMPDYDLQPTINNILNGTDTELEYVLDIIKKKIED